jgi:acid phosphatase type 7
MTPLWQALYEQGADVVLSGHEHNYERFAPQDADGNLDEDRGIRQFVVGTGGKSLYGFGAPLPTSEVRNAEASGVLMLRLHATEYDWQFVPVAGVEFADAGTWPCH